MTTSTAQLNDAPSRTPVLAALGVGLSAVLTAIGTFSGGGKDQGWREYLVTLAITVVAAAIVFGLVVRTAPTGNASRRALVLGILAALSFVVFWAGLPSVLAAGAVACALVDRDRSGHLDGSDKAAIGLSALAVAAAVVLAFVG
jgi:hypothetical protein